MKGLQLMFRKGMCGLVAAVVLGVAACGAPAHDEVAKTAKERGFTPDETAQVSTPEPATGVGVKMPGKCTATFFMGEPGPGLNAWIKVYNPNGEEIYTVRVPRYSEVVKVPQVKNTCKDEG